MWQAQLQVLEIEQQTEQSAGLTKFTFYLGEASQVQIRKEIHSVSEGSK